MQDILSTLTAVGATCISFNPLTANNIARVLLAVAHRTCTPLSPAAALGLAEGADGDVRGALQALQMMGRQAAGAGKQAGGGGTTTGGKKVRCGTQRTQIKAHR